MSEPTVPAVASGPFAARLAQWAASPTPWVCFLLLGVAIRCRQYFFAASYWYDESFLILPVRERGFAALLGPQPYNLVIPPFFLWIERALYQLGGDGELVMRLPAFLAGMAALILMVPLARRLVPGAWALCAFALMAVSPHAVSHGCEAHPYTFDLLVAEWILLCTAAVLGPAESARGRRRAAAGLGVAALVGPWISFPSAFLLAGASAALFAYVCGRRSVAAWAGWVALNGAVCASGTLLWWVFARHMYYPGMIEHWGNKGWGGFPDWSSPLAVGRWLLYRPYEAANYGNRDLGLLLAPLAIAGAVALALRSSRQAILLAVPFACAIAAALVGKYPFAHRTTMFILPCLWILAAAGLCALAGWAKAYRGQVAVAAAALLAYAAAWTPGCFIRPDAGVDYRGAYQIVHAQMLPDDAIYAQMAVVYQTYYGKDAPLLKEEDFATAERLAGQARLWAVFSADRLDLRRKLEAAGGRVVAEKFVSGLVVLLFEPTRRATRGLGTVSPTPGASGG